jgi:hypothetical protein
MPINVYKIAFRTLLNISRRISWILTDSKLANYSFFSVHLLIVKNPVYGKLAQTCVESFLHFHPNAKIIIHHDEVSENFLLKKFRILSLRRKDRIVFQKVDSGSSWQLSKLKIILDMSGTASIYMDCDLRWNGSLSAEKRNEIVFFVEESLLSLFNGVHEVIPDNLNTFSKTSMKNTSYFTWSEIAISESEKDQIIETWSEIIRKTSNSDIASSRFFARISEQIALSVMPDLYQLPYGFLKDFDKQFDGSICESSYYGASGGRFALWGNTNRRSWL